MMRKSAFFVVVLWTVCGRADDVVLTICNQGFAMVRETVPLQLQQGANEVARAGLARLTEPDSIVLYPGENTPSVRILEQAFDPNPVSKDALLKAAEGQTLDFAVRGSNGGESIVSGKVLRARTVSAQGETVEEPLVEVNGKLRHGLPGEPCFPVPDGELAVKPTARWRIETDRAATGSAELSYITSGISWEVCYSLIAPQTGDDLELMGWADLKNYSGRSFEAARVTLMAGNVLLSEAREAVSAAYVNVSQKTPATKSLPEHPFEKYDFYPLDRPVTLPDGSSRQIEFVRKPHVKSSLYYLYKGVGNIAVRRRDDFYPGGGRSYEYDKSNTAVWLMRELNNTESDGLGMPLPRGRLRFYQTDGGDVRLFGDSTIDPTAVDGAMQVFAGIARDLTGARRETVSNADRQTGGRVEEDTVEIKLTSFKSEPVEVRIVEELDHGQYWEIKESSAVYKKTGRNTAEFRVQVEPGQDKLVTYRVRYS